MSRAALATSSVPVRAAKSRFGSAIAARSMVNVATGALNTPQSLSFLAKTPDSRKRSRHAAVAPQAVPAVHELMMTITLEPGQTLPLRALLKDACGDMATFLGMKPVARSNKM